MFLLYVYVDQVSISADLRKFFLDGPCLWGPSVTEIRTWWLCKPLRRGGRDKMSSDVEITKRPIVCFLPVYIWRYWYQSDICSFQFETEHARWSFFVAERYGNSCPWCAMHLACLPHDFGLGAQQTDQVERYRIFYATRGGAAIETQILLVSGHTRLWPHEVWFAPLCVRKDFPTSWRQFWAFFFWGVHVKMEKTLKICLLLEAFKC